MVLRHLFVTMALTVCSITAGQKKQEQEFRIDKNELPKTILPLLTNHLQDVKRLRFYKEQDGNSTSFEVKFKKGRLHYSVEFDSIGTLEDVEFIINEHDIPSESLKSIQRYLGETYGKFRIKKIQQQYLNEKGETETVLKKAFQNLIIPEINYEIIVTSKKQKGFNEYEVTFNAMGHHILTRKSTMAKYDHVLFQ